MTTPLPGGPLTHGHIPLPTGTVAHRPIERRNTSPFGPTKRVWQMTPDQLAKAQREAAKRLRSLDQRRRTGQPDKPTSKPTGGPGNRLDLDVAEIVRLYRDERQTVPAIATRYNTTTRTISRRLEEAGVPRRNHNAERTKITTPQLIAEMRAGVGGKEIAEKYGMTAQTVYTRMWRLRREGIVGEAS